VLRDEETARIELTSPSVQSCGEFPCRYIGDILTRYIELKSRLTKIDWQLVERIEEERWLCSIQT
jgi:hypothetical protein